MPSVFGEGFFRRQPESRDDISSSTPKGEPGLQSSQTINICSSLVLIASQPGARPLSATHETLNTFSQFLADPMALTVNDTSSLSKFQAQYLQLVELDDLSWPSSTTLRKPSAQEWLFQRMFDRMRPELQYLPNDRYQIRVLKRLLSSIEAVIEDPDEDVSVFILPAHHNAIRVRHNPCHLEQPRYTRK